MQKKRTLTLRPRPNPTLLSFVIPCFNEDECIHALKDRFDVLLPRIPCPVEIVAINDGSYDDTYTHLKKWSVDDPRVKLIDFSRNFGHQAAVTAGLDYSSGDAVVIMDADLQDPPELVLTMLERYREGYDVAYAQRTKRAGTGLFKKWTAAGFYWFMRKFVYSELPQNTGDFRLMSRSAVLAMNSLREGQRFVRGMVSWLGFSQIAVPFERAPREFGETKYPLRKMLLFARDGILSFSSAPLRVGAYLGFPIFLLGLFLGVYTVVRGILYHDLVHGWLTLVVLQCLFGGAILVCISLVGEYVGRIYDEIKQRPIYIVRETTNVKRPVELARAVDSTATRP